MENNNRNINQNDQQQDQQQDQSVNADNLSQRVNKVNDDLDEKSSTVGRTDRGRTSGISTKDGLTGSDFDGQVTR